MLAESTGKHGKGLIPVDGEPLGRPEVYGDDRCFIDLRLTGEADEAHEAKLEALEKAGHPVIRIDVRTRSIISARSSSASRSPPRLPAR